MLSIYFNFFNFTMEYIVSYFIFYYNSETIDVITSYSYNGTTNYIIVTRIGIYYIVISLYGSKIFLCECCYKRSVYGKNVSLCVGELKGYKKQ